MSLLLKNSGVWTDVPQGDLFLNANGSVVAPTQIWIKRNGLWKPVWSQTSGGLPRWGIAQFSDTDFTGGKEDPNQAGDPYDHWTGVQDFIDSELTSIHPVQENGIVVDLDIPFPYYAYFAHPVEMGLAEFIDNENGFPGGWDGIEWPDGQVGSTSGPMMVTYDDGNGPSYWYIYRTDFSGIGQMSWTVNFNQV